MSICTRRTVKLITVLYLLQKIERVSKIKKLQDVLLKFKNTFKDNTSIMIVKYNIIQIGGI